MPSGLFSHLHLLVAAQAGLEFVCVFGHDGQLSHVDPSSRCTNASSRVATLDGGSTKSSASLEHSSLNVLTRQGVLEPVALFRQRLDIQLQLFAIQRRGGNFDHANECVPLVEGERD